MISTSNNAYIYIIISIIVFLTYTTYFTEYNKHIKHLKLKCVDVLIYFLLDVIHNFVMFIPYFLLIFVMLFKTSNYLSILVLVNVYIIFLTMLYGILNGCILTIYTEYVIQRPYSFYPYHSRILYNKDYNVGVFPRHKPTRNWKTTYGKHLFWITLFNLIIVYKYNN